MHRGLVAACAALVSASAMNAGAYQLTDSLKGSTAGNQLGGSLGAEGWTVTARTDRIWYAIPRLVSGSIQFTITNATLANLTVADNELFAMYDAGYGISEPINYNPEFRNNYYKCMLRVYGTDEGDPNRIGRQKLIWGVCNAGSPGYNDGPCPCANGMLDEPFGGDQTWDGSPVTLKVEWGNGHARLYRNGAQVHDIDYSGAGPFGPDTQHFSLGSSRSVAVGDSGLPVGAIFSDLIVDGVEGAKAPICPGGGGASGTAGSGGAGGSGGTSGCDPSAPISASLTPGSSSGKAGLFEIDYRHCQGAASLRVVQIWVTDSTTDPYAGVSLGYEAGKLFRGAETCAPGEAKKLAGPNGALDCANTSVGVSGDDLTVKWAIEFDPKSFAGTHGVWVDAKGPASANPEPRLGWTELGQFTVNDSGTGWGGSAGSSGVGGAGGTATNPGKDDGDVDGGCGCRMQASSSPGSLGLGGALIALVLRRRRRR